MEYLLCYRLPLNVPIFEDGVCSRFGVLSRRHRDHAMAHSIFPQSFSVVLPKPRVAVGHCSPQWNFISISILPNCNDK